MRNKAFTLLEVVVAAAIIAILAVIIFKVSGPLIQSATKAKCVANMKSLHTAFSSYVQESGVWPQVHPSDDADPSVVEEMWLKTMDPYLSTRKVWLCPVLERAKLKSSSGTLLKMHYIPTQFDAKPNTAYKWPAMPWLIEVADAHNEGPLILFADGSVKGLRQIMGSPK